MTTAYEFSRDEDLMSIMLRHGLAGVPKTKAVVARELRMMATGIEPYGNLANASASERNIWRAAADFLEEASEAARTRRSWDG